MNNAPSPTPSVPRSRGNGKRLAQAELPDELNNWVGEFDRHLSQVVGLAAASRRQYRFFVRRCLAQYCPAIASDSWVPRAEWLTTLIRQEAARLHGHSRKKPGTALRARLRYLVFCGIAGRELEAAIPSMPQWKYASLPVRLTEEETERVLGAALDGCTHELRNRAMLLALARTGVRACELTHLMLDDIDWVEGCVRIRPGKSHRERQLPLPCEVGEALCAYLQHERPASACRAVFLSTREPHGPILDSSVVSRTVRQAMTRADVLGHASLATTAIYAKLDLATLAHVALPWPGVRS
ncbi:tyrosine-type recombinase/integrase [Burkholderia ubonensis]|uniref:tyrosine-type recombinase/integrase n=1 Tax=Burkholderia ubonensis TaxID=101571 RepID=UPI002AAFEEE7|nr:tyrosine-type recombinase/integrase [Burkholderia ubonensis]